MTICRRPQGSGIIVPGWRRTWPQIVAAGPYATPLFIYAKVQL